MMHHFILDRVIHQTKHLSSVSGADIFLSLPNYHRDGG
jgi:hypothetical protein